MLQIEKVAMVSTQPVIVAVGLPMLFGYAMGWIHSRPFGHSPNKEGKNNSQITLLATI